MRDFLELDAEIFADRLAAGQDGDVLQHGLAAIAEARRLHGCDLEAAAQLVDDERGQRLALDVLSHDQQRLAGLHHRLEQRQQFLQARQLLFVDQDVGVLHLRPHLVGVGDEVGGDVAAVELHALDHVELGLERLRLFDRDHAFVADLLHGLGEEVTDFAIAVGGDGTDLGDLFVRGDLLGVLLQVLDDGVDGKIDAALEVHRVHAGGNRLGAFLDDRVRRVRSRWWCRHRPASEVLDATSRTICAPMFSNLSSSSISLATVTPSLVMRGAPNDLSSTTLRPFGPSVTLTAWARMSTPRNIRSRASTENLTSLAAIVCVPS